MQIEIKRKRKEIVPCKSSAIELWVATLVEWYDM